MKILVGILFTLVMMINPVQAAHQYIWNNDDYVCWLDDTSIYSNATWCVFNIIMEDRRTGKYSVSDPPMVIYKADNTYWMTMLDGYTPQKEITYYTGWWQPYGLKWLQENGYLE